MDTDNSTMSADKSKLADDGSINEAITYGVRLQNNITQSVGSKNNLNGSSSIISTSSTPNSHVINPSLLQEFWNTNNTLGMSPDDDPVTEYRTLNAGLCQILNKLPKWH